MISHIGDIQEKWLHGGSKDEDRNSSYLTEELDMSSGQEIDENSSSSSFMTESSTEEVNVDQMPGKGYLAFALPSNNISIRTRLWTKSFIQSPHDSVRGNSLPHIKYEKTPNSSFQTLQGHHPPIPLEKEKKKTSRYSSYSDTEQLGPPKSFTNAITAYKQEHSRIESASPSVQKEGEGKGETKTGESPMISRLPSNETPSSHSQNSLTRIEPLKSYRSTYSSIKLLTPTPPNLLSIPNIRPDEKNIGFFKARSISTVQPTINILADPDIVRPPRTPVQTDYGRNSIREELGQDIVQNHKLGNLNISGDHEQDGFWAAFGKNINAMKLDATVYDVMPTVLYLMGVPLPQDCDGSVLLSIFTKEFSQDKPVCFEKTNAAQRDGVQLTKEERDKLTNHLKSLGYMK